MTSEEAAGAILGIFKANDIAPGHIMMFGHVNRDFISGGGDAGDFERGLEYAINNGWLVVVKTRITLTEAGTQI
jgi:hypothetical protein